MPFLIHEVEGTRTSQSEPCFSGLLELWKLLPGSPGNKHFEIWSKNRIILAKCPNTVWVLHREKVVLGVALSYYVVLGSRVVLCCVVLCVSKKHCDSWVWRRSGR